MNPSAPFCLHSDICALRTFPVSGCLHTGVHMLVTNFTAWRVDAWVDFFREFWLEDSQNFRGKGLRKYWMPIFCMQIFVDVYCEFRIKFVMTL
jgi:hypothetical protein